MRAQYGRTGRPGLVTDTNQNPAVHGKVNRKGASIHEDFQPTSSTAEQFQIGDSRGSKKGGGRQRFALGLPSSTAVSRIKECGRRVGLAKLMQE
jgi:hypothetical protein